MSIQKSIERAYSLLKERNWDIVYWCIDLHGTVLKSNYENGSFEWINEDAKECLKYIRNLEESCMIMWTSCYLEIQEKALDFFDSYDIYFDYGNQNPRVPNTKTGCFDDKFYFSIGIDDKFGFDPDTDWKVVLETLKMIKEYTNGKS